MNTMNILIKIAPHITVQEALDFVTAPDCGGVVVFSGKIASLRRFKDDVSEVKAGFECGIGFERFNDIKVGDLIEVFMVERVAATA